MQVSRRTEVSNKQRQAGKTTDASSNIPAYDRNRLNRLLQMPLQMHRISYVGYEHNRPSHKTCYPLPSYSKIRRKVLQALQEYYFTYGYPRNILCDNGKEFCNENIDTFCLNNGITIKHGAPRTPQTQGLIERSNRSYKEDMYTCIVSTAGKNVSNWCKYLGEVCCTRNISYHSATKTTP